MPGVGRASGLPARRSIRRHLECSRLFVTLRAQALASDCMSGEAPASAAKRVHERRASTRPSAQFQIRRLSMIRTKESPICSRLSI
jgi:hypothetical protein